MELTLYSIIKGLIKEDIGNSVIDKINKAINDRRYISLYYNDRKGDEPGMFPKRKGNPRGFRRIIPYCLFERNGITYLRAFHNWNTNTKRGPFKWKLFKVENISNLRLYNDKFPRFTEANLPSNFNPDGDKMATNVLNIVNFEPFVSPLDRERQKTADIAAGRKKMSTNKSGYINNDEIGADQKRKITVDTYAKQNPKWAMYKKNIENTKDEVDRAKKFADYEKAEQELANTQQGPITQNSEEEEGYNEFKKSL
jgi:hypothetical protein